MSTTNTNNNNNADNDNGNNNNEKSSSESKGKVGPATSSSFSSSSAKSNRSAVSGKSFSSIGIGSSVANLVTKINSNLDFDLIKPRPEGNNINYPPTATYDCAVFLIYCLQHDRFALTSIDADTLGLPFVIRDRRNWQKVTEEGMHILFEIRDTEGMLVKPMTMKYTMKSIELFRLQVDCNRWINRMTQFVTITQCTGGCQPVNSIQWIHAAKILDESSQNNLLWGPEFRGYYEYLNQKLKLRVVEHPIDSILLYFHEKDKVESSIAALYQSRNVSPKMVAGLYDDYLNHTFPSFYMTFPSFRIYLLKCGVKNDRDFGEKVKHLFRCCLNRPDRKSKAKYVDFSDICYLIVAMDPATVTNPVRVAFIFSFYDRDMDGVLNDEECQAFIEEISASSKSRFKAEFIDGSESLTLGEFTEAIYDNKMPGVSGMLRLEQSIFVKLSQKHKRPHSSTKSVVKSASKSEKGICSGCRAKKYEYGQHCVLFDCLSRCVEPKVILSVENPYIPTKLSGRKLYSADIVFKTSSICNVLFDYMRNKKFLNQQKEDPKLMENFCRLLISLCDTIKQLVKTETKLRKCPSPAIVIGDIQGNLDSLLMMEKKFWNTMPVIPEMLIFLGNYTGKTSFCVEVIIYLFSIKYLAPNQVILLRGVQETRAYNEKTLLLECKLRYGDEMGKQLWEAINAVYDQLPYVVLINESIVCLPSGIPKDSIKYRLSVLLENYIQVEVKGAEYSIFHQVMTNMPDSDSLVETKVKPPKRQSMSSIVSETLLFKPNPLMPNSYLFTREAFRQFMFLNQFSHLIRSNEFQEEGYRLSYERQLITINSSVNFEDSKNKAVVAFISHTNTIQLLQFEINDEEEPDFNMSPNIMSNINL